MQEDFLHFIYKNRLWDKTNQQLITGEDFEIIDTGTHNLDSGPDFFNARIKIGDTDWAGNVEIHIKSSDWEKHNHRHDMSYNNVILHIVYNYDKPVLISGKYEIPTWEIKFPHILFNKYSEFKTNENHVHCHEYIELASNFKTRLWLDRMATERLEVKTDYITKLYEKYSGNFEEIFYISLARSFGTGINSEPFEQLAKSLPLSILSKYYDNIFKTEALLFGQSGLLDDAITDDYVIKLQKEYSFLRKKHGLTPIPTVTWKKSKLRPSNFPQIRIAQFAALMMNFRFLFSSIFENENLSDSEKYFKIEVSDYWKTHYVFGKQVKKSNVKLGINTFNTIAINTIAPVAFYYFQNYKVKNNADKIIDWMMKIKPEDNRETRIWKSLNITPDNAYESQALLNLKKNYCDKYKCLDCAIGNEIMKELNKI
ncbi:MAG TPA: DUF2851 family protein [Bacteroidales bacterium]|nr:DUF2851 family protein [Bacteroidales bacterium]